MIGAFGAAVAVYPVWLVVQYPLEGRSLSAAFGRDWLFGVCFLLFFVVTGALLANIFWGSLFVRTQVSEGVLEDWGLWGRYRRLDLRRVARLALSDPVPGADVAALRGKHLSETPEYDIAVWHPGGKYSENRLQLYALSDANVLETMEFFIRGAAQRREVCAALLSELQRLHPGFRIRPDVYGFCGLEQPR